MKYAVFTALDERNVIFITLDERNVIFITLDERDVIFIKKKKMDFSKTCLKWPLKIDKTNGKW